MEMIPENISRKLDNLGRIVIPKGLRSRLNIADGDELEVYTTSVDGINYICLTNNRVQDIRYMSAAAVLEELGLDIPQELIDRIDQSPGSRS